MQIGQLPAETLAAMLETRTVALSVGEDAPCRQPGANPEDWFPEQAGGGEYRIRFMSGDGNRVRGHRDRAARLCAGCPHTLKCLTAALRTGVEYGVWGGVPAFDITRMRKLLPAVTRPAA